MTSVCIDLKKFKVAGIGEIKTSPIDKNELSISILMNFTKKSLPVKLPKSKGAKKNRNAIDKLPQKMKDRLKRQMVKINNSLLSGKEDKYKTQINRSLDFYYKEFEDLLSKCKAYKFSYAQFGKGFLCAVYRQRKRSLYAIVSSKSQSDINKRLNGIIPRTKSLLVKGSEFNHIKLGFLMYTEKGIPWLMPGAIPVFWWPIKIEMIRKIIFHECLVVTVYNPANLIESLKKEGYRINSVRLAKV